MRGQRRAPATLYPRERPGTHCTRGWVGPRAGLDRCGKFHPPPGFDPRTVQPVVSRYTDYATLPTSYCKGLMYFRRYTWADISNKCRQMHPYITKNTILLTPQCTPTRFNSQKVILREYNWYMFTAWSTKWVTRRKFQFTLQCVVWRSSCVRSYCTH